MIAMAAVSAVAAVSASNSVPFFSQGAFHSSREGKVLTRASAMSAAFLGRFAPVESRQASCHTGAPDLRSAV